MAATGRSVTIANGTSLSGALDTGNVTSTSTIAGFVMPASWTAANLTFQVSSDDSTYQNLHDDAGAEITVTAAAARNISLREDLLRVLASWRWVKVRSGTASSPVNQLAERVVEVQARFGAELLVQLTNPQSTNGNTLDTTRLANAARDAESMFKVVVGVVYDNANVDHRAYAVPAVVELLRVYIGQLPQTETLDNIRTRFRELKTVTAGDKILASTDSTLAPTIPQAGNLPDFDRAHNRGYGIGAPGRQQGQE
jgi:hypothetical protein